MDVRGKLLTATLMLALAGCGEGERSPPAPRPQAKPEPVAPAPAENGATPVASIMRPSVIEESEARSPEPPPPPEPIRETVPFAGGGTRLDPAAHAALDALVARPEFARMGPITLRGHTDSEGEDRANLRVSRGRAEAVRAWLVEKGVAADRITVVALGERRPLAPNATPDGEDDKEGRRRNRRVDVEVSPAPAPEPAGPAAEVAPTPPAR